MRKILPVHMVKESATHKKEETRQKMERLLEVSKVDDMDHSTSASVNLCQGDVPKAQE